MHRFSAQLSGEGEGLVIAADDEDAVEACAVDEGGDGGAHEVAGEVAALGEGEDGFEAGLRHVEGFDGDDGVDPSPWPPHRFAIRQATRLRRGGTGGGSLHATFLRGHQLVFPRNWVERYRV